MRFLRSQSSITGHERAERHGAKADAAAAEKVAASLGKEGVFGAHDVCKG